MDNNAPFLEVYSKLLEQAGYRVLRASSLEAADQALNEKRVHLAVLDIRMQNDDDANDVSGLMLAQKPQHRAVPKIILTGYPSVESVRAALSSGTTGVAAAVDFLSKSEGPEALLQAVRQAFEKHVQINWDLVVQAGPVTFLGLAELINPGLQGEVLDSRAEELKDLFRQICYEQEEIKLDRVLWHNEERVAVAVMAFTRGKAAESLVIVCGLRDSVSNEARRYREFGPKAPGENATVLARSCETVHFGGNLYAVAGADLEDICSLSELYHRGPEKVFNLALERLIQGTLAAWHRGKRVPEEDKGLGQWYAERFPVSNFAECLLALKRQVPAIGVRIESGSGELHFDFGAESYSYPDPVSFLHENCGSGDPTLFMQTPGTLSGENILADGHGRTWLTDFAHAGLAPAQWNFVALEAVIRFDWVGVKNLRWLHQMEQLLTAEEFVKLRMNDLESPLRKPLRAIEAVRRLASGQTARDSLQYHRGMFFHVVRRMADFNPDHKLTPNDLARTAHLLIAAALIAKYIDERQLGPSSAPRPESLTLSIDPTRQEVWVGSHRITLSKQNYKLLSELNQHAEELCTHQELIERALGLTYYDGNESQIARLNTAVRRLRQKIENDPDKPRFIRTEPGRGYRLVLRPGGPEAGSLPAEHPGFSK